MSTLTIYDDRYTNTQTRTYGDKFYINFHGLNVAEDDIECEFFTVISIDSLLTCENKYYMQVYLENCAYKVVDMRMVYGLGDNPFETDED